MAAEFRCEKCGTLLDLDVEPGQTVKCPHCRKKTVVPEALASLPRPQVAPDSPQAEGQEAQEQPEEHHEGDQVIAVMARGMPYVISIFFHLGIGLLMMLIAVIVKDTGLSRGTKRPDADVSPTGEKIARRQVTAGAAAVNQQPMQSKPTITEGIAMEESSAALQTPTKGDTTVQAIGRYGGPKGKGGELAKLGPPSGGSNLLGVPARADDVVYVIDRSGSMAVGGAFDQLRLELAKSISGLDPSSQRFDLIFFGGKDKPKELGGNRLIPPTVEYKEQVFGFLEDVRPEGQTLVISALEQAFSVLGTRGRDDKRIKLIWLLSDGDFEGFLGGTNEHKGLTGNDAVVAWLNDHNKKVQERDDNGNIVTRRRVKIYTFLYRGQDPRAVEVMQKIAAQHDGKFTHVTQE